MRLFLFFVISALLCFRVSAQDAGPSTIGAKQCRLGSEVIVPNILGFSPDKAAAIAEGCGLKWSFSEHPQVISYESIGTIGSQEPRGGKLAKQGDTLRGIASKGVFLPSFIGWDVGTAEAFVHDIRQTLSKSSRRDAAAVGTVVEQSPLPAVFYDASLGVSVVFSEGPWVEIPDLKNKSYYIAVAELKNLKLVPIHGGGDLESGSKQVTNCELIHWFPIVEEILPFPKAFEGDTIVLKTKRKSEVQFSGPPGIDGKICD